MSKVYIVVAYDSYNGSSNVNDSSIVNVFASRQDAMNTIQELRLAQEADEARAWAEDPCSCGDRNCDYHMEQFSFRWRVEEWNIQPAEALV